MAFFATSHGKGLSDGVGGSAARASLQRPFNGQIMTPRQLFVYAKANITGVHFQYSTKEEYDTETLQLEARLINARTIPGTLRLHTFMPKGRGHLEVEAYSNSSEGSVVSM